MVIFYSWLKNQFIEGFHRKSNKAISGEIKSYLIKIIGSTITERFCPVNNAIELSALLVTKKRGSTFSY